MFERALIVEDNDSSLYYLRALLEAKGKQVETAADGEEALKKARLNPPHLVVSDLLMPVMDGFSLLSEWSEDPGLNTIPFVIYTGTFTSEEDRQLALHLGADAFLVKPMEPDALMASLEKTVAEFTPNRCITAERKLDFARRHADILIRKLTERNRELERERVARNRETLEKEALFDALDANIAILDSRGTILRVNQGWQRFARENDFASTTYGVGRNYLDAIRGTEQPEMRASIEAVLSGELDSFFTDYPCHSTTHKRWFRMLVTPLKNPEPGAIVFHLDISKRKLLEEQLLRTQRLESIGTLAGGVAHDLNNSLAPISVALDLLKARVEDATQRELLSSIENSAERGRQLVKQLLRFARGEEGERHRIPISKPLDEVHNIIKGTFPNRITLKYEPTKEEIMVRADQTQLYQVFLNICLNARDAIEAKGCIEIQVFENAIPDLPNSECSDQPVEYACVEIADTGHGISEQDLERIFEPFFTTKPRGQGTGLGLATSKSIIESHGGHLRIESRVGEGTRFRVYLPVCRAHPVVAHEMESREPGPEGNIILVVDDEATIRELVIRLLEAGGYQAVGARNGLEALSLFRKSPHLYSTVLTDMTMPAMDGAELVAEMRKCRSDLRVVVCSGLDSPSEGPLRSLPEPYSFLRKPFSSRELLRSVNPGKDI